MSRSDARSADPRNRDPGMSPDRAALLMAVLLGNEVKVLLYM